MRGIMADPGAEIPDKRSYTGNRSAWRLPDVGTVPDHGAMITST